MKLRLEKSQIEMHSTHNEGKSVFAERFIRTLKNKIYKYMTSISKNVYIDKLDDIVNTYRRTIKMKPVDVKPSTNIDSSKELNDQDLKFKIGDIFRISKFKNIFAKGYVSSWSEEVFVIKTVDKRFIRTLKNKIYKYMTSISKNMYIDKLDDIDNPYRRTIKMKPVDVKPSTHIY